MRIAAGDVLISRCGRFHVVTGSRVYTLLDRGHAIERGPREDLLMLRANEIVQEEKRP